MSRVRVPSATPDGSGPNLWPGDFPTRDRTSFPRVPGVSGVLPVSGSPMAFSEPPCHGAGARASLPPRPSALVASISLGRVHRFGRVHRLLIRFRRPACLRRPYLVPPRTSVSEDVGTLPPPVSFPVVGRGSSQPLPAAMKEEPPPGHRRHGDPRRPNRPCSSGDLRACDRRSMDRIGSGPAAGTPPAPSSCSVGGARLRGRPTGGPR